MIPLAIAAAILPVSVMASGPVLYGKIHFSLGSFDNGGSAAAGNEYKDTNLASNSSRVGVKGSEDLGNGLKVGYKIEWGISADGSNGDMGQRNRGITIGGGFGTIVLGRWDTPMKSLGYGTTGFF